jgi:hypothetical protein
MMDAIIQASIAQLPLPGGGAVSAAQPAPPKPLGRNNIEARFSFDEELSQIVITLRDSDSGQVIRQIPPEKVLRFAEFLLRTTGRIVDARA